MNFDKNPSEREPIDYCDDFEVIVNTSLLVNWGCLEVRLSGVISTWIEMYWVADFICTTAPLPEHNPCKRVLLDLSEARFLIADRDMITSIQRIYQNITGEYSVGKVALVNPPEGIRNGLNKLAAGRPRYSTEYVKDFMFVNSREEGLNYLFEDAHKYRKPDMSTQELIERDRASRKLLKEWEAFMKERGLL